MRLISGLIDCAYTCSYAVLEHSNTNTKTSHIWTKSINAFTQLSNPQWNKGCYRQAMLFHNRKTNKAACDLLALEVCICWWVFQSWSWTIDSCWQSKYENLPILSKQHMIIRHQQQIVRFTHKTFRKIWVKNKLKVRILVFRGPVVVHIILFQSHF